MGLAGDLCVGGCACFMGLAGDLCVGGCALYGIGG